MNPENPEGTRVIYLLKFHQTHMHKKYKKWIIIVQIVSVRHTGDTNVGR